MMSIQTMVNFGDLKSLKWGIGKPAHSDRLDTDKAVGNINDLPPISWHNGCSPAETQHLCSCDANATANLLENKIYREYKIHVTIDADRIYQAALERYHRDSTLLLGQALETCYSLGLITEDCSIKHIPATFYDFYQNLKNGPVIVAHNISEGWRPINLINGIVDDKWSAIPYTGHATLAIAYSYFEKDPYILVLNSWGPYEPMGGITALSLSKFLRDMIDDPVIINWGSDWLKNKNWEKYVI